MKRKIVITLSMMLVSPVVLSMSQEDLDLAQAIAASMEPQVDPELERIMQESARTAQDEKARILSAGNYEREIDGYGVQQLALSEEDTQSGENITCGPKVLFIAQAMTNLVKTRQIINPATMHAELVKMRYGTKTNQEMCKGKQLEAGDFESYMSKNKISLPSFFALGAQGNMYEGLRVVPLKTNQNLEQEFSEEDFYNTQTTDDLSNQLQKTIAPYLGKAGLNPVHFFCDDARAGHWFLISVVKDNNQFKLWYIDPKNTDVNLYPYAHTFIPYIYRNLVDVALAKAAAPINRSGQIGSSSSRSSTRSMIKKPHDPSLKKK